MQTKNKHAMEKIVTFRVSKKQYKKIRVCASVMAGGDVSAWIRHCLDQYTPQEVVSKRKKTGQKSYSLTG